MANVRYTGGRAATLGTKTIDENGVYNASSDGLDGFSSVNVEVPQPEGNIDIDITENGETVEDIADYATATINVDVPIPVVQTQEKTVTATTSQQIVRPDTNKYLSKVTVNPQVHSNSYTPTQNTTNDMGAQNNYRYVDTRGLYKTQGAKSLEYTANGVYNNVDVNAYQTADITVNVPGSGTVGPKTITVNGVYQAIDDNLDGYDEVTVNVPQNATLGVKNITANGDYYASADSLDGYSRVSVAVPGGGSTLQDNKTVTATTSQQIVQPDPGYDGLEQVTVNPQVHTETYTPSADTAANDMGANNNYRYVNTSGMHLTNMLVPSNTPPTYFNSGAHLTATGNGYAITGYTDIMPSNASPVRLNSANVYRTMSSGYAIQYYIDETPSDIDPPIITTGNIIKATANGYLYATQQGGGTVATGTFSTGASGTTTTISCGFEPKKIFVYFYASANSMTTVAYDEDMSANKQVSGYKYSSSSSGCAAYDFPGSSVGTLNSKSSTGFTYKAGVTSANKTLYYVAIG